MKPLYLFLLALMCGIAGRAQSPGYILDAGHEPVRLDTTDGRKLLIVLLPTGPDTALTGQLLRFQVRHGQTVRVIGVLAQGTGALVMADAQNSYAKLPAAGITLTEGMAETDSIAGVRGGLLKYLSRKSRNRQNDPFAEGAKYFLSEKGRLFAQLGRAGSLDSRVADYIVQTHVPGEDRY